MKKPINRDIVDWQDGGSTQTKKRDNSDLGIREPERDTFGQGLDKENFDQKKETIRKLNKLHNLMVFSAIISLGCVMTFLFGLILEYDYLVGIGVIFAIISGILYALGIFHRNELWGKLDDLTDITKEITDVEFEEVT